MFRISEENFLFKPDSVLSNELIDVFKDVYAFAVNGPADIMDNFLATMDYFEKTSAQRIKKIIKNHLGIEVIKIINKEMQQNIKKPTFSSFYACNVLPMRMNDKPTDVFKVLYNVTEGKDLKALDMKPETYGQISKVLSNFDSIKESFSVNYRKGINIPVKMIIYFDLASAMYINHFVHDKLEALSPEEQTAILLHELGHVIGPVVYFKFKKTQLEIFKGAFDHFNKYADVKEKLTFYKSGEYKKLIIDNSKISKDVKLSDTHNKKIDYINKLVELLPSTKDTSAMASNINFVLDRIIVLIGNILCLSFGTTFVIKFWLLVTESLRNNNDKNISVNNDFYNRKTPTGYNDDMVADAFVTSHNMGSYLIRATNKIENILIFTSGTVDKNRIFNKSTGLFNLAMVTNLMTWQLTFSDIKALSDVGVNDRIKFIMQKQLDYIKQLQGNTVLQKMAIKEYEDCYAIYQNNIKKVDSVTYGAGMNNFLANFINLCTGVFASTVNAPGGVLLLMFISNSIIDRNLYKQIDSMLSNAESLINSDMHASIAKLNNMI